MDYPWAVPGVKVERVAGEDFHTEFAYPAKGRPYTIRDVFECPISGKLLLHLEEVKNTVIDFGGFSVEPGFDVECFRPLHDLKSDIAMFQRIAHQDSIHEPEGV